MTLMKAKKPLALLLALLAALSLLGTTALAAGLPEETIAAQTELCGEDCGHTHEEVFSHTEHAEESLPEPEEIAVPVATPLLEQPEPEAEQPSDTSGVIPGSGIYWELNEYGWLMLSGNGSCPTFVSPDDQPWAAVREQITQVWFEDMDALSIPSLAYWFTGCTALTMAEIPYTGHRCGGLCGLPLTAADSALLQRHFYHRPRRVFHRLSDAAAGTVHPGI